MRLAGNSDAQAAIHRTRIDGQVLRPPLSERIGSSVESPFVAVDVGSDRGASPIVAGFGVRVLFEFVVVVLAGWGASLWDWSKSNGELDEQEDDRDDEQEGERAGEKMDRPGWELR